MIIDTILAVFKDQKEGVVVPGTTSIYGDVLASHCRLYLLRILFTIPYRRCQYEHFYTCYLALVPLCQYTSCLFPRKVAFYDELTRLRTDNGRPELEYIIGKSRRSDSSSGEMYIRIDAIH